MSCCRKTDWHMPTILKTRYATVRGVKLFLRYYFHLQYLLKLESCFTPPLDTNPNRYNFKESVKVTKYSFLNLSFGSL